MHAIAHGGCTGTIRESALEVVSGTKKTNKKKKKTHRGLEPVSVLRLAFQSDALLYQLNYARPKSRPMYLRP